MTSYEPRPPAPLPPLESPEASWERLITGVVAHLRERAFDEATIARTVALIRDHQYGPDRERNPLAEFAPPPPERVVDAVPPDLSAWAWPIEDQPTQLLRFLDEQPTQPLPGATGSSGQRPPRLPRDREP
jgi:hypothetical protein